MHSMTSACEDKHENFFQLIDNLSIGVGWKTLRKDVVASLQQLACHAIEDVVRKSTDLVKDPICRNLISVTEDQQQIAVTINQYVEDLCPNVAYDIFQRVISYNGDSKRKATPMDVWALIHSGFKQLSIPRPESQYHPLPNTHKAILDTLYRLSYLEHLNLAGLDEHSTPGDYNDLMHSREVKEHYLYIIDDCIRNLPNLITINLGTLVNNSILRTLSKTSNNLREIRLRGPAYVTDLGVRYLIGMNSTAEESVKEKKPGCFKLEVVDLTDLDRLSLHTITLLLINLSSLKVLEHNHLHEALWMMDKTGMDSSLLMLKLLGYNGRGAASCKPEYLEVLAKLCPKIQKVHLCMTWPESFLYLSRLRDVSYLSVFRVSSVENFDLPMMAFGNKLVKLELVNCTNFQSGTALNIRKHCENLQYLKLEIDSTDANSNAGIAEALQDQNIHTLENQVSSLQERLTQLQITMLDVMNKYGNLRKLEELHLKNLGMGSLLILLPFCPFIKKLTLKYSLRSEEAAPNVTDSLFLKIFEKNKFENLEKVEIWCKSLSIRTAEWFVRNCSQLNSLKSLSAWNTNEEEQVALWREGRRREPNPVEVDF